jgi:DNA polymerase III subunit delta'
MYGWHTEIVRRVLRDRQRLAHALLIQGPEGIGVPEFGVWLAQCLLCEAPCDDGQACRRCAACNWFAQGNHPDFRLLQPDSHAGEAEGEDAPRERKSAQIRIDQIRMLEQFLSVGTHRSGARVILLHPADSMNGPTQNALLKSLEEPAPQTFFLLATSLPDRLLPTVRSRCQALLLPRPGAAEAAAWLKAQGVADPEPLLALAAGAPILAAGMAEQRKFIEQFVDRLADPQMDAMTLAASAQTVPVVEIVTELYRWCYDLLCSRLSGRVRYHATREDSIARAAKGCNPVRLAGYLRSLSEARALAQHPLNARLFVEDLLLAYSRAVATDTGPR